VDDGDAVRTGQDVVREVLAALAPGELPQVASVLAAYRRRPWRSADGPDGPLAGWAPFVLGFVAETVVPPAGPTGRGWFAALSPRRRRARTDHLAQVADLPVPAFDHAQLCAVWAAAVDAATERGCSAGDREAFAAAVVAAFAVGHLPGPRRPPGT
jgi:hypothetical protein